MVSRRRYLSRESELGCESANGELPPHSASERWGKSIHRSAAMLEQSGCLLRSNSPRRGDAIQYAIDRLPVWRGKGLGPPGAVDHPRRIDDQQVCSVPAAESFKPRGIHSCRLDASPMGSTSRPKGPSGGASDVQMRRRFVQPQREGCHHDDVRLPLPHVSDHRLYLWLSERDRDMSLWS
jgi:hypothetical protein